MACEKNLPLHAFYVDKKSGCRSTTKCKECYRPLHNAQRADKRSTDQDYRTRLKDLEKKRRLEHSKRDPSIIECPDYLTCYLCKQTLLKDLFGNDKARYNGKRAECKECSRKITKVNKLRKKEKNFKPVTQRCEICGFKFLPFQADQKMGHRKDVAVWDHNHETDQGRGWLCMGCNSGLGLFGDNPSLLIKASEYLKSRGFSITRSSIS
jgi:hypothetical protein